MRKSRFTLKRRKFWRRRARRLFALRLNCDARRALVVRGRRSKGFFARGERRAATISFFPIIAVSRRLSSRALCLLSLFRNAGKTQLSYMVCRVGGSKVSCEPGTCENDVILRRSRAERAAFWRRLRSRLPRRLSRHRCACEMITVIIFFFSQSVLRRGVNESPPRRHATACARAGRPGPLVGWALARSPRGLEALVAKDGAYCARAKDGGLWARAGLGLSRSCAACQRPHCRRRGRVDAGAALIAILERRSGAPGGAQRRLAFTLKGVF